MAARGRPKIIDSNESPFERYERVRGDPELVELESMIFVIRERAQMLIENSSSAASPQQWTLARSEYSVMRDCIDNNDNTGAVAAMHRLGDILNRQQRAEYVWHEVQGLLKTLRELIETEEKRRERLKSRLEIVQVMEIMSSLLSVVLLQIPSEEGRKTIRESFYKIIGGGKYSQRVIDVATSREDRSIRSVDGDGGS
jgi:hypothetical protein